MTNHLTEEQLVLHYYGESENRDLAQRHIDTCDACRAAYTANARVLDACNNFPVPEKPDFYGAQVWRRIEPRLAPRRFWSFAQLLRPRPWVIATAMAAMLIGAFLAGSYRERNRARTNPGTPVASIAMPGAARERILMVALGDHLDRSQMVLVELVNTKARSGADIHEEQQRAQDLVSENRLYRLAATKAGDTAVVGVLDDLERVLLDIAHSPSKISSPELQEIQQRIEDQGILFKIRVVDSNVRQKGQTL